MKTADSLKYQFKRIDGKGYKAYKDIKGQYSFPQFQIIIDHVQGDPFAAPSRIRVKVDRNSSGFEEDTTSNRSRTVALCDFLTRQFYTNCKKLSRVNRGTGKSGLITIAQPGQEILERSSMVINENFVEARFFMGLPAHGRRISGNDADIMFFEELPAIVAASLFAANLNRNALYQHIKTSEDADILRGQLKESGLIGFVADGALLPRASGIDQRPMDRERSVVFQSPQSLKAEARLPNAGKITGMGIPKGVTLIVGGGYHGKSTLLNALELGIYNHIPGDGRERAVTLPDTVKIRAADGRNIEHVDISAFINNLPQAKDTLAFSTQNASGSTSQAANISEAIEAGAKVLLLDEDTSATNFMIRDHRMQQLVTKDKEPITPFIDKIRQLYHDKDISTVLVMGGSGDYFSVSDHVIQMTDYIPSDVTDRAHYIANQFDTHRMNEGGNQFGGINQRIPMPQSFNPYRSKNRVKITAPRTREIVFGRTSIDLWDIDQLVDISQTRGVGFAIHYATRYMDGKHNLRQIVERVIQGIDKGSLDILVPYITGDIARFRGIELAAAINRIRTLKVKCVQSRLKCQV
ncbi:MAG: ABC-ATPase domain-containing protein [Desulfobacterales bacterium]|nr:MAG: ABC-ATPase domain-containing protein [Desulfobacterales bacterium]